MNFNFRRVKFFGRVIRVGNYKLEVKREKRRGPIRRGNWEGGTVSGEATVNRGNDDVRSGEVRRRC